MADLRNLIDSRVKEPSISARFDGKKMRNIVSADIQYSINNSLNTASIVMSTKPPVQPESKVTISQGYDGKEALVFTGLVDSIQQNEFANTWTISCRDMLKKAMDTFLIQEIKFGIDVDQQKFYYSTYVGDNGGQFAVHEYASLDALHSAHPETNGNITSEGVLAEAVVQWLLHMSGLDEGSEIQVDSTNFFIGDISPVTFHVTSVYDALSQICELIGWYVYCDVGGVCRFKKRPRTASGYSVWTYDTKSKYNVISANMSSSNTDLRNYVEVHGASGIKVIKRASSPYLGDTPYRGVLVANDLIDTSGIATFIAGRILNDLNRLRENASIEVDGNPYIFPGQSIRLETKPANGVFMVETVSSSMSADAGYKMNIGASSYPGDTLEEDDGDIEAVATVLQVVSIGDPTYLVLFDGSSSYSNRGPIVSYDWTFPDPIYNKYGSASQVWAAFEESTITGGNSAAMTLTVYDEAGNTDTLTSGITLEALVSQSPLMYRHLYAALTTKGVGSQDGGGTWNTVQIPALSVAASNYDDNATYTTTGYALFGTSDGKIYKTEDFAQSVREVTTLGGRVTHVHIAELSASRCLASTSDGEVYRSTDKGETWTLVHNFGEPVKQAEFGYQDFNYMTVITEGNRPGAYITIDAGATWIHLTDFGDKEMNWYAGGASTPYFAHTQGVVASRPAPDPLLFPASGTANVVAMTVNLDDDAGVMVVDNTGQHWNLVSGVFNPTAYNGDNITRHMVRDGDIPPLVYYATVEGVYKSLDNNTTIMPLLTYSGEAKPSSPSDSIPSVGWGEMVAYGPLAPIEPPTFGRIVVMTNDNLYDGPNPGMLYSFSGYTQTGMPVYRNEVTLGAGYSILVSGGLCGVNTNGAVIHRSPMSAGPGYFVTLGAVDTDVFPYPAGYHGEMNHMLYAIDFTGLVTASGVAASGQFFPQFYPVKWWPKTVNEDPWDTGYTTTFNIDVARMARNPLYAAGTKNRVYVACQRIEAATGRMNYVEAFDIPRGSLQNGTVLHTLGSYLNPTATGRIGGVEATDASRADTLLATIPGGGVLSPVTYRSLIKYDSAGNPTETTDGAVEQGGDDDYRVFNAKFSTGWRAVVSRGDTLAGQPVLVLGPSNTEDLNFDYPLLGAYTSAVIQTDVYYATQDGFYKVPAYGQFGGLSETLFVPPSGFEPRLVGSSMQGGIITASVTYNNTHTRDFIVLTIAAYNSVNNYTQQLVWSKDGGTTWEYSPQFRGYLAVAGAWWIDP